MTARFIAFEGGEGSGKSTQARRIAANRNAVLTRQPGGTDIGSSIREILLSPQTTGLSDRAEALLMAADRAQHVHEVIRPALAGGRDVICDRYVSSSLAYQGAGRGLGRDEVLALSQFAVDELWPDLNVLLDVPPAVGLGRLDGPPDRLEQQGDGFHDRVRSTFLDLASANPETWVVIDGTQPLEVVSRHLDLALEDRLGLDDRMIDVEPAWATVVGQADAMAGLRAWSTDPVHAYLFVGPSGSGKRQAARAFSAAIQAQLTAGDDAAQDRQMRLALQDKHPDVEIHEPAGSQLLVDAVRQAIIPSVFRKPADGPRRIVVIDRFHDAQPAAAAALLKTVEEPPPSAIVILLAESVPTEHVAIASRCARIEFPPLSYQDLEGWLARQGVALDQASLLIEAAAGDLRRLELLTHDGGFSATATLWRELPSTIDGSGATAGRLVRELMAMIAAASEPLTERHAQELVELDAREEMLGTRGSGRSGVDARHKRELRRLRVEELQFGLRVLARRYRAALADGGGSEMIDAVDRLREANDALIRNPNEALLLHNLFWNLPPLRL